MRRLLMSLAALTLLTACSSSGDDDGVTPPSNQGIGLQLGSSTATVARGTATQVAVSLNRIGAYGGIVALRAENLPAGVTATFTSPQLVGSNASSTLILDASATAAAGTTAIIVRATGNGVTDATATFSLVISAPPPAAITLVAGSSTATAAQGATATVPLAITRSGGFTGAVDLTAEGLPTGVTASFAPASIGASAIASTLTLTAAATATPGTNSIVVRASGSGVTAQTATIAFTVTSAAVADFALTANPASISLTAGQSGTSAIAITRSGGFTGNVALSLPNAPSGVTGVFAPNPTNANASVLTISTTAAVTPGTYNLTVLGQGTLTGATALTDRSTTITLTVGTPPGLTLSLGATTLSAAAGTSATNLLGITRVGGFTGDVTLALENAPSGVTGAFAPATIGSAASASTLTLTVGANTAVGTYTVTVRASGNGITARTATFTLTVTAAAPVQGYTLAATAVTAQQNGTGTSTVSIARTGGFAGTVNLAVSGLPSGVTATFNPAAATGASSTLTLSVGSGVGTGSYTGTITGTATGLANVTTSIALTVTAGSTGGGGNIAYRFCDPATVPAFFAYRNGSSGPWTAVTPSNNTFSFSLSQGTGQVAYGVTGPGGRIDMTLLYYTAAEFPGIAARECIENPATKTVTGVVGGLALGQSTATVSVGSGSASVQNNGPFSMTNATDGLTDLIATRSSLNLQAQAFQIDRVIVRRGINPTPGGAVGALIDFGSTEAAATASTAYTVANANGETLFGQSIFTSANGATAIMTLAATASGNTITLGGVPNSLTQAGDLHSVLVSAGASVGSVTSTRGVFQFNRDLSARTVTLGPSLSVPQLSTVATTPYARVRAQGTWQADYGDAMGITLTQGNTRTWTIAASRGYFGTGATTFDVEIPDLSGVAGFNGTWGLSSGSGTFYSLTGYAGFAGLSTIAEGTAFRFGARSGSYTP